jgi:hypothetical protein
LKQAEIAATDCVKRRRPKKQRQRRDELEMETLLGGLY